MRVSIQGPALAVLACVAFCADGLAQKPDARDQDVKARVERRLAEKGVRGIKVDAAGGSVTLTGRIASAGDKQDLVSDVLEVAGVQEIVSELTIARSETDLALAERAATQTRHYSRFTIFDEIEVHVNDGIVTMMGYVTTPIKSQELEDRLSHIPGVQELVNKVEVLPASLTDDRLRNAVAAVIYRDPLFINYAQQKTPPLHIIVRNSSVLLTGVVNSEAERIKAESLARSVTGVVGVQSQLRVER